VRIPEVVSVSAGPPVGLVIRMLPGQRAEDFTAHASAIGYHLGVAEVRVGPLDEPSLCEVVIGQSAIRRELPPC